VHQPADAPVETAKLFPLCLDRGVPLVAQPVHLVVERLAELLEQIRGHQLRFEGAQDSVLEVSDSDVQAIAAGALVPGGGAAEQVLADLDVATAAGPALGETG